MSFRLRIMTLVGGALLLAFVGLGYALLALFDTRDNFASFVDNDLVELHAYQEMYAQGLQMGQALRNMLLDPANPQALKNLNKGSEEFDAALAVAGKAAATSGKGAVVQAITELRQKRKAALDKVLAAVASDRAKAVEILNAEETPAWREIRKQLLDTLEASKKQTQATKAGMIQRVDRAVQFGLGLGLVSLIVAVVLIERLLRNLRRELGGEPSEARAIMHRVAEGDFTVRIEGAVPGSLLAALADMVASLRGVVAEIERQAEQLALGAEEVSRVSASIAEGAGREAEAASGMAATIQQFTVSAAHISASASDTRSDSEAAAKLSQSGEARVHEAAAKIGQIAVTVDEASGRIRALDERAGQVSAIAGVIKDIAGQTNLLALNAAIEAARAGELGRGFAVVADEVRKLAERTSTATVEIEAMIGAIQGDTEAAVRAMAATMPEVEAGARLANEASASLNAIREGAARTLARVHEMADATGEQSSASTVIAQQVEQVARMVEETSAAVHTTAQTAASLEAISRVLKSQVQRFKV